LLRPDRQPDQILSDAYKKAMFEFNNDNGKSFLSGLSNNAKNWLTIIVKNAERHKAIVTALATSLTKKIETPAQDIRYHQEWMLNGYSGRTFDTKYVTPFFKKVFPHIAMKESGWLTRSLEQPYPFTLDYPGHIKNKEVKDAFLQILNDVEVNKADPEKYLIALFILLIDMSSKINALISQNVITHSKKTVMIETIINCLKSHFFTKYNSSGASMLPPIAVYSLYKIMVKEVDRYKGKKLKPLRSHFSPDIHEGAIGDIEVVDENEQIFEAVEIKYDKPITTNDLIDAYKKFQNTSIKRYYLLTTNEHFIQKGEEGKVESLKQTIRHNHGCEIIINGIIESIKYYLRLIKDPNEFIEEYTNNLRLKIRESAGIKSEHVEVWFKILQQINKS
jgi:DNA (cytosine-5)-methyltransferase 1